MHNCTREVSRICFSEGGPQPVIEPGMWVLDGEGEHLLCGSSGYSFMKEEGGIIDLGTKPFP